MLWMTRVTHHTHTLAVSSADGRARVVDTPEEMERGVGTICHLPQGAQIVRVVEFDAAN
jgi:hypothetical protein